MMSVSYSKLGLGNSLESFQRKFIVPRYLNILVSRYKNTPAFLKAILEDIDLREKLKSFEMP